MMEKLSFFKAPSLTVLRDVGRYRNEEIAIRFKRVIKEKSKMDCDDLLKHAILSANSNDYIIFLFKKFGSNKLNIFALLWLAFGRDRLEVVDYLIKDFAAKSISLEELKNSYDKFIDYKKYDRDGFTLEFQYIV